MHKNADTKEMFDCSQLEPQSDAARKDIGRVCRRCDALVLWLTGKEEGDNRIPTKAVTSRAAHEQSRWSGVNRSFLYSVPRADWSDAPT